MTWFVWRNKINSHPLPLLLDNSIIMKKFFYHFYLSNIILPSKQDKWVKKSLYACIMWLCLLHCESNFSLCPFFIFSKFKIITLLSINIFPKPSMLKKYKYVLSSSSSTLKKYYYIQYNTTSSNGRKWNKKVLS